MVAIDLLAQLPQDGFNALHHQFFFTKPPAQLTLLSPPVKNWLELIALQMPHLVCKWAGKVSIIYGQKIEVDI